jgi:hypothetical protein
LLFSSSSSFLVLGCFRFRATDQFACGRKAAAPSIERAAMKIGILSDTHGDTAGVSKALAIFQAHGVTAIVHCGDVGSAECVRLLAAAGPAVYMVAGNVDRHIVELEELAEGLSVQFASEIVELPLGAGKFLAVTHGDDAKALGELIHDPRFAYVCHGHTHQPRDQRIGTARVINPGALRNARTPTVAVLDTETDTLDHIVVL